MPFDPAALADAQAGQQATPDAEMLPPAAAAANSTASAAAEVAGSFNTVGCPAMQATAHSVHQEQNAEQALAGIIQQQVRAFQPLQGWSHTLDTQQAPSCMASTSFQHSPYSWAQLQPLHQQQQQQWGQPQQWAEVMGAQNAGQFLGLPRSAYSYPRPPHASQSQWR